MCEIWFHFTVSSPYSVPYIDCGKAHVYVGHGAKCYMISLQTRSMPCPEMEHLAYHVQIGMTQKSMDMDVLETQV
jgi:hypothetical protein